MNIGSYWRPYGNRGRRRVGLRLSFIGGGPITMRKNPVECLTRHIEVCHTGVINECCNACKELKARVDEQA
jgi:hypothetical protein